MSWLRLAAIGALVAGVGAFAAWLIATIDWAERGRDARACDVAIERTGEGAPVACSDAVTRVIAERDAGRASISSLRAALDAADKDRDAAVQRAEARAIEITTRNASNVRTIEAAPRLPDGRVHCDAECVRALAGAAR